MKIRPATRTTRIVLVLILAALFCFGSLAAAGTASLKVTQADKNVLAQPHVADTTVKIQTSYQGKLVEGRQVGPGLPPAGYQPTDNLADLSLMSAGSPGAAGMVDAAGVPAMKWTYGCSATSATMYFGYYDRNGYPDFYTGPTNGGMYPLTNEVWGESPVEAGVWESPLTASHRGYDGRTTKGHVDDYYGSYLSTFDPYYLNWTEHSPQDSIADYMGTNQYQNWYAEDGSTWFFTNDDGTPCYDFTEFETTPYPDFNHVIRDGNHGMKLFAQSRGYNVTTNYNQLIYGYNGNTNGFTYAQYKAEIDSGNPVIIQVSGHTMLGVGYSGTDQVIVHNTWDYNNHTMTWGGSYEGMQHYGVSVVELERMAGFTANTTSGAVPLAVQFTDESAVLSPTEWNWSFGDGGSFVTTDPALRNASHTYTATGTYTVSLNVSSAYGSSVLSRPAYITVKPCVAGFTANATSGNAPVAVRFTDASEGTITAWNWSFGDGNAWKEQTAAAGWAEREATATVVFPDGTIVLMGGTFSPSRYNDTWRSTDYGATWTLVNASSGWTTRYGHTAVALPDGTIVLMGGYARSNASTYASTYMNDTWISADRGATWTLVNASSGWAPRSRYASVALSDNSIVLMGGMGPGTSTYFNDTWRSTDRGATWTPVNVSSGWSARYWFSSVALPDDSIVLTGGDSGGSSGFQNDTWISTDRGATWTQQTAGAAWLARRGLSTVALPDSSIVLTGGNYVDDYYRYSNETWQSTDRGVSWIKLHPDTPWADRHDHSSVAMPDGSIVLMAGYMYEGGDDDTRFNDVWWFNPAPFSTEQDPVHTYAAAGTYTVSLNVTSALGSDTLTKPQYIHAVRGSQFVPQGGSVAIGEAGLDISDCTGTNASIAWWQSGANIATTPPSVIIGVSGTSRNFLVDPNSFAGHTGTWYSYDPAGTSFPAAFTVIDPSTDLAILDTSTSSNDVTNSAVPAGDEFAFRVTTSLAGIASQRGIAGIPYTVRFTDPSGATLPTVTSRAGTVTVLNNLPVNTTPWSTGGAWDSANALYPTGNYTARAEVSFNGIRDNYKNGGADYTGKTVSASRFVLVSSSKYPSTSAPTVTAISPAAGSRNSSVPFTITGTGFADGSTTVEFRNQTTGLITATLTSVTAKSIQGTVSIPANATPGAWNLRVVTTGGGEVIRTGAFTIANLSKPTIASILPAGPYYRNTTVNYTITGTNFQAGKTTVLFRNRTGSILNSSASTVNSGVWLVTPTKIYGTVVVPFNASAATPWNITVTTVDSGSAVKEAAFTVSAAPPRPTIVSILPAGTYYRNATINYTITGTNFQDGNTTVLFRNKTGTDLNATSTVNAGVWSVTPTKIYGTIVVPFTASSATPYNITVTTLNGGTVAKEAAFSVVQRPAPAVTAVTPASASRNATIAFTITGTNFQADNGTTNVSFVNTFTGAALYGAVDSVTATKCTGTLGIPADATNGGYDLIVTTADGGSASRENAFTINYLGLPTLATINQTTGYRNSTVTFLITGTNFQAGNGTSVALNTTAGARITAALTSVTATKITGTFTIPVTAATGKYRLDVSTLSGGTASRQNAFTIAAMPKPAVAAVTPVKANRNTSTAITITGTNFLPDGGTAIALVTPSGTAYLNTSITGVTPTRINATVAIPADAATGAYNLSVTSVDSGTGWRAAAFTVSPILPPTFTSITPATGLMNSTVSYTIQGTNFQPGLTIVDLSYPGFGELNTTLYSVSSTQIIGGVSIPSNAPLAGWTLNITTVNGGKVTKARAFTVAKVQRPAITTFTPSMGYRGTTVSYIVNGKYFEPGGRTSVNLSRNGAPEIQTSLTAVYSSRIYGTVTIPADAPAGYWTVNVTTIDGGTGSGLKAINVL